MAPIGIGERLRNARQALGVSLEEIESATRIRRAYLEALEHEAFGDLPNAAYVRGFLRSYAAYLGIPPDELLSLYPTSGEGLITPPESAVEVRITRATGFSPARRIAAALGIAVGLGVLILGFVLYGQIRQFMTPLTPPGPPVSGGTPGSPTPGPAPPSSFPENAPAPQPAPAPAPATLTSPIHIIVVASGRSWVRTVVDGTPVFEGFLVAGDKRDWQAAHTLTLRAGNAGVIEITVNDRSLGQFGGSGEVIERTLSVGSALP